MTNLLKQDFTTSNRNQKWVADITYIHTLRDGWTYLASVMDLYSRKIIGYSYDKQMTSKLVLDSIKNALLSSDYPKSLTLHSDLGTQYTSDIVMNFCKNNNITQSFSNKGNPYDNACIESFHSILKKEEVHHRIYYNLQEARRSIFEFIE